MKKFLKRLAAFLVLRLLACAVALSSAACGRYWVCDEVDEDRVSRAPRRLSETGLFADTARESLAPGVLLSADFAAPIAGSLGGSTFSGSLLVTTSW